VSPAATQKEEVPRRLGLWRVEWLRMLRSPRGISLVAVYLFFGALGPLMARYMSQILKYADSNMTITVSRPRPVNGIENFLSQVNQTGLVVVVVVAAGALCFDARRGVSTFLRTRVDRVSKLIIPRFTVNALVAVTAYTLGTLIAWYETALLIGSLPAARMIQGWVCGVVYLVFAIAVVAAAASLARTVLGTVGIAIGCLLVLPLVGTVPAVHQWLPSSLATAPVALLGTAVLADYLKTVLVAALATVALLALAVHRLQGRDG
jgi:ABC-2 type transport system permease protein